MTLSSDGSTLSLPIYWSFNDGAGTIYNGTTTLAVTVPSSLTALLINQAIVNAARDFFDTEFSITLPTTNIHIVPGVSLPPL